MRWENNCTAMAAHSVEKRFKVWQIEIKVESDLTTKSKAALRVEVGYFIIFRLFHLCNHGV